MRITKINIRRLKLFSIAFLSAIFATACNVVPAPIDIEKNENLIPFEQISSVMQQTDQAKDNTTLLPMGKKARWGGKIVSVENKKDVSEIEIVFFPENSYGKPRTSQASVGRFKAVVQGFVDPIVFEPGRLITVVGEVGESQTGIIGEQEYKYPTLNALGYHMWKQTSEVEIDTFSFAPFGFYAGYNRSFFSPWYDPWHFRHHRQRVRLIHNNGHQQGSRAGRISPSTPANASSPVGRQQGPRSAPRPAEPFRPDPQNDEVRN